MQNTTKELLKKIGKENTGLIIEVPKINDFVAGLETGIAYEETNPTGEWGKYYPTNERQSNIYTDFLCCTSASHTNIRETRINYKLRNNLYPDFVVKFLNEKGYIDANGNVNFSERFLAKLVNTDVNKGASFANVAEAARTYGLVPESAYPIKENMTWAEFYAPIPTKDLEKLLGQGKEFLEIFDLLYEWVDMNFALVDDPLGADTLKALKQSPLQVALGIPGYHAIEMGEAKITASTEKVEIYDSYPPFVYTGDKSLPIHYSMKLVDVVKEPKPQPEKPSYTFLRTLKMGMSGQDVNALQKILKFENYFTLATTNYFGTYTKAALQKYQQANGLKADGIMGPITMANLNAKYGVEVKKKALE